MKLKIVIALIFASNMVLAEKKPINPAGFEGILGGSSALNVYHYCHMESVYMALIKDGDIISASLVWDFTNNRPYRCDEFPERKKELVDVYNKEIDEYYKRNPRKKPVRQ